jgi:GH25 family lysozyme M1 (1,4-beta-N-acetylmuramidase)
MTITARAHGPDMSKYDLHFKPELATEQMDFVIQRASYRTTKDEAFDTLYPGVAQMPIRLAYHYLNSDTPWLAQADKFLSIVDGKGFHAFVCDFESSFNVLSLAFAKEAWEFIKYVAVNTGKRTMLYTNRYHYQDFIFPSQATYGINWNQVDYWQAQYYYTVNADGQPLMPNGRTAGWNLWQYTAKANGTLYGLGRSTACDLNVFNGTPSAMRQWLGIAEPTPEPTPTEIPRVSFSLVHEGVTYEAIDVELKPK